MKYIFIINPHSRSGMGGMIWELLEPELKKRRVEYESHLTGYPRHAIKIAAEITGDGEEHTLVVLGGDGTVNEVINGIQYLDKIVLGYIPTGSSNDFARGLKLPQNPMKALDIILTGKAIVKMDVGCISRQGKTRRFAVSAGMGFDAAICHQAAVTPLKARLNMLKLGKLTYVCIALDRLFRDKKVNLKITLDGHSKRYFHNTYFAAVMNNPYEGGGFCFCPNAVNQDGMLDVIVVSGIPRIMVLFLLPTAYKGWHIHFPGVSVFRCKRVSFETEKPLPLHTDGEPVFVRKKMNAEILPGQIRIIAGENKSDREGKKSC